MIFKLWHFGLCRYVPWNDGRHIRRTKTSNFPILEAAIVNREWGGTDFAPCLRIHSFTKDGIRVYSPSFHSFTLGLMDESSE